MKWITRLLGICWIAILTTFILCLFAIYFYIIGSVTMSIMDFYL